MKFTILLFVMFNAHNFVASATELGIRVLLNKGAALPSGETCSSTEWSSISSTISTIVKSRRRNLRQLQTYPSWCAEKCRGFAKGFCQGQHDRCDGYRRLDDGETVSSPTTLNTDQPVSTPPASAPIQETLSPTARNPVTTCGEGLSQVNAALNALAARRR